MVFIDYGCGEKTNNVLPTKIMKGWLVDFKFASQWISSLEI